MPAYHHRLLHVDLTTGTTRVEDLDPARCRAFIGGSGLAASLFFERLDPRVEPFDPANPLIVMNGPLGGSTMPGSSRFAVCSRSPLTGIWGEGTCGGDFAPGIRSSGYDGFVFTGASEHPVTVVLDGGRVELLDARALWGKDNYELTELFESDAWLRDKRKPRFLTIGQAGENLVRFAAIANGKHDFVGRTGMGAVMGSKRLKAIVVYPTHKLEPSVPDRYKDNRKAVQAALKESMPARSLQELGTDAAMDLGMMTGDIPIKNWRRGEDHDLAGALGGPALADQYLKKTKSCYACPISCKRVVEVASGPHAMELGSGPEFETCCTFGTMIENADLAGVIKSGEWCNRYGMDTISCGATVAFAYEAFERGLLAEGDTGGVALRWGDVTGAIHLVHLIARREGVGDLLADGVRLAAARLGRGADGFAVHVKGLEVPMHDPRGSKGLALSYMVGVRGACHKSDLVEAIEHGIGAYPGVGFREDYPGLEEDGKAELVKLAQDLGVPLNAMSMCEFDTYGYTPAQLAEAIATHTGHADFDVAELLRCGERIWLLKRGIDNLFGITRADDRLPPRLREPLPDGAAAGAIVDEERLLVEYYALRGLDDRGVPTRGVLERAGLTSLADRLGL